MHDPIMNPEEVYFLVTRVTYAFSLLGIQKVDFNRNHIPILKSYFGNIIFCNVVSCMCKYGKDMVKISFNSLLCNFWLFTI